VFTRPPELTDAPLVAEPARHWDVGVDSLEYVALGFGSHRRPHVDSTDVRESYRNLANSIDAGRRQTGSTDRT
jgi:hypothetical protein